MTEGAGLARYLKEAFLLRWNVLLFGAGTLGALLSGRPDALLPLVGVFEALYLVALVGTERFRTMVDANVLAEGSTTTASAEQASRQAQAESLFASLQPHRAERFTRLRQRCLDVRFLAKSVGGGTNPSGSSELAIPALDRLFWVFLKLLVSQQALERFLTSTDLGLIERQTQRAREQLATAPESDDRLRAALADSIKTLELRLSNYQKAQRNAQFITVELDRLEAKIQALTEMTISHEEPNYISAQVDSIAQSMSETEAEIRELDTLTGYADDEFTPEILDPPARMAR